MSTLQISARQRYELKMHKQGKAYGKA